MHADMNKAKIFCKNDEIYKERYYKMSEEQRVPQELVPCISSIPVYLMVFCSGFAGLVYQILWMKQLGFLFGNTSHAAAATLAAFFAGLAVGNWFWGRRSTVTANPLRVYAWLEAAIGLTALLYFVVLSLFYLIYPFVYQGVASRPLLLGIKFILALVLIFPPAFCMGGTIPVIGQFLIRSKEQFGVKAARLYGINTLGAALGAFMAGFCIVRLLGFRMTCVSAMVLTVLVAATAYYLSGRTDSLGRDAAEKLPVKEIPAKKRKAKKKIRNRQQAPIETVSLGGRGPIYVICFLSGFGVLALEVLWTRMFAQVHENSIYSFSAVLVIVLLCLALGALIASRLARLTFAPMPLLACLLILGGLAVAVTPFAFKHLTDDFQMLDTSGSFLHYMFHLFLKGFACIGVPALFLGTIFPFLMKTEERFVFHPGRSLGRLSAVNTVGAILGSVVCGFVMLELCGMWRTMQLISAMYLIAGLLLPAVGGGTGIFIKVFAGIVLLLLFTGLSPAGLPVNVIDPARPEEEVLQTWETSDCTVTVVQDVYGERSIKINSNYSLGSTGATMTQAFQGRMPMLIYPETRSLFFLGMGTGMTAGGALDPQFEALERVVVCELVPEVVTAAKKYMTGNLSQMDDGWPDFTGKVFEDKRVEIIVEDGRHYLMASDNTFDMINADLFLPYRSGAGSLYSREHFESVREKLNPGGVFVQWLPLYQITDNEFGIIARTMLGVFEQVTMWRNNFQPGGEVVALVGHRDDTPLPGSMINAEMDKQNAVAGMSYRDLNRLLLPFNQQTALILYCGNVTAAKELFMEYPENTDDKPVIEYSAPLSIRIATGDLPPTLVGPRLEALVDKIQAFCPPATDPMLVNRTAANRRLPIAGAALYNAWVATAMGNQSKCRDSWKIFVREWTNQEPASPEKRFR